MGMDLIKLIGMEEGGRERLDFNDRRERRLETVMRFS